MAKEFDKMAAQGDMLIRKITKMPSGLTKAKSENGQYVLAHSETGHHHVVLERSAQHLIDKTNEFISYLSVSEPCEIEHLRPHDTHEAISIAPGIYEIRRQQEYVPGGLRRAQD